MTGHLAEYAYDAFLAFGVAPAYGAFVVRAVTSRWRWTTFWCISDSGAAIVGVALHAWRGALVLAAGAVVALLWGWWNRKGKRAAKQLGEKSRAVIAGLVERMRGSLEGARP